MRSVSLSTSDRRRLRAGLRLTIKSSRQARDTGAYIFPVSPDGGVAFSTMKLASALVPLVLTLASTAALAHAHLQKASPADGSVITTAPQSVVLEFSEPARLATLWITRDGGSRSKLAPLPQQPQQRIAVTLPELVPGTYVVSWRVVGADGHVVPGQIRFTLRR